MSAEVLMIFLLCVYVPLALIMGIFGLLQILTWWNE
jgi:hypothetical protein